MAFLKSLVSAQTSLWLFLCVYGAPSTFSNPLVPENMATGGECVSRKQISFMLASHELTEIQSVCANRTCQNILEENGDIIGLEDDEDFTETGSGDLFNDDQIDDTVPSTADDVGIFNMASQISTTDGASIIDVTSQNVADDENSVHNRSLCPWRFVKNIDPDRHPEELWEAECECSECRIVDEDSGASCEKIYESIAVLRRAHGSHCMNDGEYEFKHSSERIAVACTCSMDLEE